MKRLEFSGRFYVLYLIKFSGAVSRCPLYLFPFRCPAYPKLTEKKKDAVPIGARDNIGLQFENCISLKDDRNFKIFVSVVVEI